MRKWAGRRAERWAASTTRTEPRRALLGETGEAEHGVELERAANGLV
jgi:hypothetical protein